MSAIRLGLLAPDPLRVLGLQTILGAQSGFEVVALETPTAAALAGLALVLVDGDHPDALLSLIELLVRLRPLVRLLVLGMDDDPEWIARIVGAGAKGYLLYRSSEAELLAAVHVVLDGSIWAPRKVLSRMLEEAREQAAARVTGTPEMSRRELAVLRLLVEGNSNREIGRALGIEEGTVKSHLSRMMARTQTTTRTGLTMFALQRGLVGR